MDKKEIRKTANRIGAGLLVYEGILLFVVMAHIAFDMVCALVRSAELRENEELYNAFVEEYLVQFSERAVSTIIAVLLGAAFLFFFFRKTIRPKDLLQENRKMTAKKLFQFVCLFLGTQLIFDIVGRTLEAGLNCFGLTAVESIEAASAESTTISMFLYACILGPIVEELVYRGFVLHSFQKYGKMFALIVSAALFGIMHGNLPQGIFAFGVGLILGYVAMEYSLIWSMALHIINNMIICDLLSYLIRGFSEKVQNNILSGIFIFGAATSIIILWKKRKTVAAYRKANKSEKKQYLYLLTSIALIIFVGMQMFIALSAITPL